MTAEPLAEPPEGRSGRSPTLQGTTGIAPWRDGLRAVRGSSARGSASYAQILDHLAAVRQTWRTRRAIEGVLLSAAVGLGLLVTASLADQLARFDHAGRVVLGLAFWGGTAAVLWQTVRRRALAAHSDDYFAALVERSSPVPRSRFINALQLARVPESPAPRLVEAIVNEGAAVVDELEPSDAVAGPDLRRNFIALAAMLIVGTLYRLAGGPGSAVSMARVLLPSADIAPFTWTRVAVTPDADIRLLEGTPLEIKATADGRVPERVTLHWKAGGVERAADMDSAQPGAYAATVPAVQADLSFRVHAGDAWSRPVRVTVDLRPRVDTMDVSYAAPRYAGIPPTRPKTFDGHLRGLPQTVASVGYVANKPLQSLLLLPDGGAQTAAVAGTNAAQWSAVLTLAQSGSYRLKLKDTQGYEVEDPTLYTITLDKDAAPSVAFSRPAADLQRRPDEQVEFDIAAQDDLGLAEVALKASINDADPASLKTWNLREAAPQRSASLQLQSLVSALGLSAGDRMQYWAEAVDRNDVSAQGPGRAVSRRYTLLAMTPDQAASALDQQLADYAAAVEELIRLQRENRGETASKRPAGPLAARQSVIRRLDLRLAESMEKNAFPAVTVIRTLRDLAESQMARAVGLLENARDAGSLDAAAKLCAGSLPLQDEILATLEEILARIGRSVQVRKDLKKLEREIPADHEKVVAQLDKLSSQLDKFLGEMREVDDAYERLAKRDKNDVLDEKLDALADAPRRLDTWKEWFKDSVDAITKLPEGFVKDSYLAETLRSILEEIEKKPRKPTVEIATPVEEGAKALTTEMLEDLEVWMPDRGDSIRWVMEDPVEGTFQVPEMKLSSDLQDIIGELIEDLKEFDEEADDVTGGWGGNMQAGWDIADGPISSFNATGKTGNQMPNASEMTGRSGSGRRGRSSGQMVGDVSKGLEGRPTPARVTKEPYQDGVPKTEKQLDPRGATGGGRKTGGGQRGLQGGTPPDVVKDMKRLESGTTMLREKAQEVARRTDFGGRPATHVMRSIQLLRASEDDLADRRYDDAARKRKLAVGEMKAAQEGVDQAVGLSLQKARQLPAELREEIAEGSRQPLPEGFEDLVGAYYKALSTAGAGEKP